MKKTASYIILVLFVLGLFVTFANFSIAQTPTADQAAEVTKGALSGFGQVISDNLSPFFGEKEMLTRVFFAFLIFLMVQSVVPSIFHSNRWVNYVISGIVTLLALIALPADFIGAIRAQYGAMGAALLSAIPFVILLVATARLRSALLARVIWIFYFFYYLAIYLYMIVTVGEGWITAGTIPYLLALVAGLVIFLFIGPIRNALFHGEMSALKESGTRVASRGKILHQLQKEELEESYGDQAGN